MRLKKIRLKNFMCFLDSGDIPVHDMTIFIGENDCGKTTILKALNVFFDPKSILSPDLFHRVDEKRADTFEIQLYFEPEEENTKIELKQYICDNLLSIRKVSSRNQEGCSAQLSVLAHKFDNDKLNRFREMKAPELKALCGEIEIEYNGVSESKGAISNYINEKFVSLSKNGTYWENVLWSDFIDLLPSFESYDSSDYADPKTLIAKTLKSVYRSHFYGTNETGSEAPLKEFSQKLKEIKTSLDKKIEEDLKNKVKCSNPKIKSISGDYGIDFAGGFQLNNLLLDLGQGPNPIENIGEGTKKRLSLAIMEWDREVRSGGNQKSVVRAYDEPDTSLHYLAQKHMFSILKDISSSESAKVQTLICTHSVPMVDRVPPSKINHLIWAGNDVKVEYFVGGEENDIKEFMNTVHEVWGMKNSSLFFERCFLVVEGNTEENSLPFMYQKAHKKTLSEDGVIINNLENNAAWEPFLKLLGKYKKTATVLLLDKDIQADSKKRVTVKKLNGIGFGKDFLDNNVFFAGQNEFEDMFSDAIICRCLNKYWAKNEGETWIVDEISGIRSKPKFSSALEELVEGYRGKIVTSEGKDCSFERFKKPEFGRRLAEVITEEEIKAIPTFANLFSKISEIID